MSEGAEWPVDEWGEPVDDGERARLVEEWRGEVDFDPDERPDDPPELDRRIDYLLGTLRDLSAELARDRAVAEKRHEDVDRWLRSRATEVENRMRWIEDKVRNLSHGYDFGRKKSRRLPNGRFGWRSSPDSVDIVDNDKAVHFARERGLHVKESAKVYVRTLVDYVKTTGEHPDVESDGFRLIPGADSFFISPEDPDE